MSIDYLSGPPRTAELVIVGGGVVGAATAWHSARAGLKPVVIERRPALCTLTTAASTGAFRLQFDNKEELDLVGESVELFLGFEEMTGQGIYDIGVRRQGYLWVTTSERRAEEQRTLVELQHGWGLRDVELLDGDEAKKRFPYVTPDVVQARYRAADGFLDPKALTMGLVESSGAPVAVSCEVTGFDIQGGRLAGVKTSAGAIATERAVIAAGPFSAAVAGAAGIELPVTTVARHKVVVAELEVVPGDAPMTIDDDTGAHWRPALRGAFLLYTDPGTPASPPADDVTPDSRLAWALLDPSSPVSVARVAPFWRDVWAHNGAIWSIQSGHYTMTADHRPLLGETGVAGLYVNTGYSGHGIMASPAASRVFVDVLTGRLAEADNPFRLDRLFEPRALDLL